MNRLPGNPQMRAIGEGLRSFRSTLDDQVDVRSLMQSAVADLIGENQVLMIPLKDIFTRQTLLDFSPSDGVASAAILRQALLSELKSCYTQELLDSICSVLNGYLDIAESGCSDGYSKDFIKQIDSQNDSDRIPHGIQHLFIGERKQPGTSVKIRKSSKSAVRSSIRTFNLDRLLIVSAVVISSGIIAWRMSLVCHVLGYCPNFLSTERSTSLLVDALRTLEAAQESENVDTLDSETSKLRTLITALESEPLTLEQSDRLKVMDLSLDKLEDRLKSEQNNNRLIRKAFSALDLLSTEKGEQRAQRLREIDSLVSRVSLIDSSFLANDFARLKKSLSDTRIGSQISAPPLAHPVRSSSVPTPIRREPARPAIPPPPPPPEQSKCGDKFCL